MVIYYQISQVIVPPPKKKKSQNSSLENVDYKYSISVINLYHDMKFNI